jgi:type VI secretion system protein ImpH
MATPSRQPDPPLERELFENPQRFDFFQAVRLLERLRPGSSEIGGDGPPRREAVRFRAKAGLAFPASQIHQLESAEGEDGGPSAMTVAFLGLTGPLGVLPHCYSELVARRIREGDHTLEAFLDLFHHRMTSHFYRAWERSRPAISQERGSGGRLSRLIFALIGLATDGLHERNRFPDAALLPFASAFARRQRPIIILERLLNDHFGLPVAVESFVGRWLKLDPADYSRLKPGADPKNALGVGLVVGTRVWDQQGAFRLVIGPLTLDRFRTLSPDGETFRSIAQMTRMFVDGEFEFDIQLVLLAKEVPACQLGRGSRMGRDAWLKSRPFVKDAKEAIFPAGA